MAANTVPITPGKILGPGCLLSSAQADKTGLTAGNIVTLYTAVAASAGGQGALVQDITATAPSATSTTTVASLLLVWKNVGGVRSLIKEIAIPAGTGSATAVGATTGKTVLNEWLNPGDKIDVGEGVTLPVHVTANVGEF